MSDSTAQTTNCHEGSLNDLAEHSRLIFDPTWATTARGFRIGTFRDRYGQACSIQESSLATEDAIWLGPDPCRMHLTREQVRGLVHVLSDFLADGNLRAQFEGQQYNPEVDDEQEDEEDDGE
jgi:hypothetical protein